jgi:hypothetical protein
MKLGIINGWSEGCISYVHDKGLDAVEFCVNYNYDSADFLSKANEIRSYSEKYNVSVGAIGRWGMQRINDNGEIIPEALQNDKNLIEAAGIIGCPVYNCGVNYTESKSFFENCEIAINYFKTLVDFAKDFKTVEQRRHSCTTRISVVAIFVSILIGIASPFISKCISEKSDKERLEQVISAIKEQKSISIDKFPDIIPDTLNIRISDAHDKQPINLNVTVKENQPTKVQ